MGMGRQVLKNKFTEHIQSLQDQIIGQLRSYDSELFFSEDLWKHRDWTGEPGGGGRTMALRGRVFENGGVNTSTIWGAINPSFAKSLRGKGEHIWACGLSFIIHPLSPRVPSVHGNFRMIEKGDDIWFGGGVDLTPYYPYFEDFRHFHQVWRETLSPYGVYEEMKKNCDEYFVNHHRGNEMRGVGGIFFDHYHSGDLDKDLDMVVDFSNQFIRCYFPIVEKREGETYSDEDVEFQLHRRGRYVEFNLLHDRGTRFGLQTKGSVESILISLPARCCYSYRYCPPPGGPHEQMMDYYFPREWES